MTSLQDDTLLRLLVENNEEVELKQAGEGLTAKILSNIFLFFLIFGLSATVHLKSLKKQLNNKFAIGTGVAMQFLIMPLLGFLSVLILSPGDGFTYAMGVTLLVVTSSPGGSYSNWWCSLFNADLALSVAMTAVSTFLSIAMLPLNLLIYTKIAYRDAEDSVVASLDYGNLFISLGIVLGAIISGLGASYYMDSAKFMKWANRLASVSGIALILVSALLSSVGTETKIWNQHWKFYLGTAMPCLLGIAIANCSSRSFKLSKPECVAISIECCYQNTGIATSVAVTMFTDPEIRAQAVAVPLLYGGIEALVIGIYCVVAWKAGWTKAPATERLCTVLNKSYELEPGTSEEDDQKDEREIDEEAGEQQIISSARSLTHQATSSTCSTREEVEQEADVEDLHSTVPRIEDESGGSGESEVKSRRGWFNIMGWTMTPSTRNIEEQQQQDQQEGPAQTLAPEGCRLETKDTTISMPV